MFLGAVGLNERQSKTTLGLLSGCGLEVEVEPDPDLGRNSAISFWDCSPYPDLAQTWLENGAFSIPYDQDKDSTPAINTLLFSSTPNLESSSSLLFTCEEPFPTEPSVLKQATFEVGDPWKLFLSPDLTNTPGDFCSPLFVQGGNNPSPSANSPALNDFADLTGAIWADSLSTKVGLHSPNIGAPTAFIDVPPTSPSIRSQSRPKGLLGWGDTSHLVPVSSTSLPQIRPKSPSQSPDVDLDHCPSTLDVGSPLRKRRRQPVVSRTSPDVKSEECLSASLDSGEEDAIWDSDDSDDYRPSPSPSPGFDRVKEEPSTESLLFSSPKPTFRTLRRSKVGKTKKAKKKGSAALALAVVTQIGEAKREAENLQISLDPDSFDPVRIYHEGGYVVKKRKNQSIPIPIPVPNLNKRSRGRKVPFAGNCLSPVPSSTLNVARPLVESNTPERPRARKKIQTAASPSGAGRSFICVIPGCGKCFVRSEHLKRHVRSIHTNDKPHVCPIEGCDKSFSRRDNLGQHVRVHLQP